MRIYFSHLLKISTESITFTKESIDITVSHCIFNLIEEVYGCRINRNRSNIVTSDDIKQRIQPRAIDAHKGTCGHALLIAGQRSMAGAAILSARAALRSGTGLVTIHTPSFNTPIIQCAVPEAIISEDHSECHFTSAPELHNYNAIAVGPGLGTAVETSMAIEELLNKANKPIIIDADALNIISKHRELMAFIPKNSIITPHPRELQRFAGEDFPLHQRLDKALEIAQELHLYVIVKGAYTATVTPEGRVYFNTTGNPGMATAGSGDVLTGILAALLAQRYTAEETCIIGTFAHGLSGDIARQKVGTMGLIASDIIDNLPQAWTHLSTKQPKMP
jgi:NAD(P)H-hydrate epimerase